MSAEAIATVTQMMRTLPDSTQQQVADHISNYIADLKDDMRWDESFKKTEPNLIQQARLAKQQIAEGKASRMDINHL
ncbi:MAG: hypothetical protein RLZZ384_1081 [Pseudomonadota bacterium]|jgi:hypothetical protein